MNELIYIGIIFFLLAVILYDGLKIKLLEMEIKEIKFLNKVLREVKKKRKTKK